jgi:hypothetical protein
MTAGSGPQAVTATAMALAGTTEVVLATLPPMNWNNPEGNLLEFDLTVTTTAGVTVTFRIRQGTAVTGTQVGGNIVYTAAGAATTIPVGGAAVDSSAFGQLQSGGQYVLTAQASAAGDATIALAVFTVETLALLQ